jgi:hypothetical protein
LLKESKAPLSGTRKTGAGGNGSRRVSILSITRNSMGTSRKNKAKKKFQKEKRDVKPYSVPISDMEYGLRKGDMKIFKQN